MHADSDWRLHGQERWLPKGAVWFRRPYAPANPANDHDHCEFCTAKFMVGGAYGTLAEGYADAEGQRWICAECFQDFRGRFEWREA